MYSTVSSSKHLYLLIVLKSSQRRYDMHFVFIVNNFNHPYHYLYRFGVVKTSEFVFRNEIDRSIGNEAAVGNTEHS